jgi:LmbE family N-acetylglucosaminyl deacetylase
MPPEMTVLVVAAHPDDEILGCGATIARHADNGDRVHILIMGEGATSRGESGEHGSFDTEIGALQNAARQAAVVLGAESPRFACFPDNRMDSLDLLDVIKVVEKTMSEIHPDIVYTHHGNDLNIDHRLTHNAVATACRPVPGASVAAFYTFETVSSTEWSTGLLDRPFNPNRYVDVEQQIDRKFAALQCYQSELRPYPHARSIEAIRALASLRGAQVGMRSAEAFMVIRELVR